MRMSVDTSRLRPALAALSGVTGHRETLPILSGVLLEASEGALRLTAHDLSLGLEWTLPAAIDVPGATVLPLRPLADLSRRLESDTLIVDTEEETAARLSWRQGEASVGTMAADEFPRPPFAVDAGVSVSGADFRRGVEHVAFASGYDPGQPVLEGIRVRFGTDTIEFLATDRSKVAYSIRPVTGGTAIESSVVFPAKALVSLGRLSGQTETYAIAWDSHGVTVRFETARFYSRLLDGVYPDVDRMVPDEYPVQAVLSRLALRGACDRVASLVDAAMPQVYLSIGNDRVSLRGEAGSSRAEESVAAQRVGEDLAISFNGRLLLEGIDHLEGDEIVLELRSPEDLMRMRPVDRRDQYVVILPMMQG